jgi:Ca2+-transporting ATPase
MTINLSALAIAILAPFFGVKPPFSLLQLLWINVIMDTLAAIALCAEPPGTGLMRRPPRRREENIVTAAMLWTILTTGGFFVVVMLTLLLGMNYGNWFAGREAERAEVAGLSVRQGTIFFSVYVFFQVWNEFNCRSLVPEMSGLEGLRRNRTFLAIVGLIVAAQVLIVSFGGRLFQVEPLSPWIGWPLLRPRHRFSFLPKQHATSNGRENVPPSFAWRMTNDQ